MTSQHTRGPWVVGERYPNSGWVDITSPADARGLPFVSCKHHDEVANARLIAEAPAMYDVLRGLSYWFHTGPEVLDAMNADERADRERQRGKIDAILARVDGGKS